MKELNGLNINSGKNSLKITSNEITHDIHNILSDSMNTLYNRINKMSCDEHLESQVIFALHDADQKFCIFQFHFDLRQFNNYRL
ncbi:MAG: hypothetical protein ABI597_12955 [Gammaproteobacteria bacterium]